MKLKKLITAVVALGALGLSAVSPAFGQSGEATFRVNQLEEQVRRMNGQVEELTFQLLQLQELVRKMQEDNEFRFQELEERGEANTGGNRQSIGDLIKPEKSNAEQNRLGKLFPPKISDQSANLGGETKPDSNVTGGALASRKTIDGVEIFDGEKGLVGNGPQPLGTIVYNRNGEIVDSGVGEPIDLTKQLFGGSGAQVKSALPSDPEELYSLGYNYIQSGDYGLAEEAFSEFMDNFPTHLRAPDANFWLAESHFARRDYDESAKLFLNLHKNWPEFRLGPQALLKLGISVAGLDQRELACATFAEVPRKYPNASAVVLKNVKTEQRAARCTVN